MILYDIGCKYGIDKGGTNQQSEGVEGENEAVDKGRIGRETYRQLPRAMPKGRHFSLDKL
jgi:hypothetical protein